MSQALLYPTRSLLISLLDLPLSAQTSTVGGLSVVRFPATVTLSAVQISVTRPSQLVTHDFNDDTGADTTSVCCMISAKPFYTAIHSAIFTVHNT
jgi:hypothetical protein